jgi:hypothetical protein
MADYMGVKFRDGTVRVMRRKPGEVWDATLDRALTDHYGPGTAANIHDRLRGYATTPWASNARRARTLATGLHVGT